MLEKQTRWRTWAFGSSLLTYLQVIVFAKSYHNFWLIEVMGREMEKVKLKEAAIHSYKNTTKKLFRNTFFIMSKSWLNLNLHD